MGRIINPKGSGNLINVKGSGSVFNIKPVVGSMDRKTADDVVTHLFRGMSVGPGWFMYITYPETIEVFP